MVEFLRSEQLTPPKPVTRGAVGKGEGSVETSFERGALILRDEDGAKFRLSWEGSGSEERERALPAGDYVLTGYRILRRDDAGVEWHVSATAQSMTKVKVKAGRTVEVEIDPSIRMGKHYKNGRVGMLIRGEHHSGLSIYKEGKRIPIGYKLTTRAGKEYAAGPMKYG